MDNDENAILLNAIQDVSTLDFPLSYSFISFFRY